MSIYKSEIKSIKYVLKNCLHNKFQNYKPEPTSMPFHTRLLDKNRMALYPFIHSLNTNFGTAIFEPVALSLAQKNFKVAQSQMKAGTQISEGAHQVIQEIMDSLATAESTPNKSKEI